MTWENGEHALLRIYSKDMKDSNGIKIRKERQEYPGIRLDAAIHEKIGAWWDENIFFASPSLVGLRMSSFSLPCIVVVPSLSSVSFIDSLADKHAKNKWEVQKESFLYYCIHFDEQNAWSSAPTNRWPVPPRNEGPSLNSNSTVASLATLAALIIVLGYASSVINVVCLHLYIRYAKW